MPSHARPIQPTRLLAVGFLWVGALVPTTSRAQVARLEVHPFQTTTLTDQQFLSGQKEGRPAVIAGELRIPKPGTDRLPAIVLIHGSGGVGGYVDDWLPLLNGMGVATFVVDGFTGRGIVSVFNDEAQLGRLAMTVDAYRALELLAKHPRIDPERIALMGFSRGGQDTLYAAMKRFQGMQGPAGASFAAYIAFYPVCNWTYIDDADVVDRPIRVFHGGADEYAPACRSYVERLRKAGKDVVLTEYAGAQHAFDWQMLKTPQKLAQAQTVRHCKLQEVADGRIVNSQTGETFTYEDPCVERGTTVAYHAQAHAEAQKAVRGIVAAVLRPK